MGAKGHPKTGGRTKGTPNKVTRDMREVIREAFEKAGGVDYLVGIAHSGDPRMVQAFLGLLGKIVPRVVELDGMEGLAERILKARARAAAPVVPLPRGPKPLPKPAAGVNAPPAEPLPPDVARHPAPPTVRRSNAAPEPEASPAPSPKVRPGFPVPGTGGPPRVVLSNEVPHGGVVTYQGAGRRGGPAELERMELREEDW